MTTRPSTRWLTSLCVSLPLCLAAGPPQTTQDWLTQPERDFFRRLGHDVTVGGKSFKQPSMVNTLGDLKRGPETPIRAHIEEIIAARDSMLISKQEENEFLRLQRLAVAQLLAHFGVAALGPELGYSDWESTKIAIKGLTDNKFLVESWKLQASWIERALDAQGEVNAAVARITDQLEARTVLADRNLAGSFRVECINHRLKVVGKLGTTDLAQPVVQFTMRRSPINVKRVGTLLAATALLHGIRPTGLGFDHLYQRGYLALAHEKFVAQPIIALNLLPTVPAGQEVAINLLLSPEAIASLRRIDLKVWTGRGYFQINDLPGLDAARDDAIKAAEVARLEERKRRQAIYNKRMAELQKQQFFKQMDAAMGQQLRVLIANANAEQEARLRAIFGRR